MDIIRAFRTFSPVKHTSCEMQWSSLFSFFPPRLLIVEAQRFETLTIRLRTLHSSAVMSLLILQRLDLLVGKLYFAHPNANSSL